MSELYCKLQEIVKCNIAYKYNVYKKNLTFLIQISYNGKLCYTWEFLATCKTIPTWVDVILNLVAAKF